MTDEFSYNTIYSSRFFNYDAESSFVSSSFHDFAHKLLAFDLGLLFSLHGHYYK